MKKTLVLVVVLISCIAFIAEAKVSLLGIQLGPSIDVVGINGARSQTLVAPAIDVDIVFHKKYLSWGIVARNRYIDSYAGSVKYFGAGVLLGYYSNKNNAKNLGWHITGSLDLGLSNFSSHSGYMKDSYAGLNGHGELALGLDYIIGRPQNKSADSWDIALTFDLQYEGFSQSVLGPNNNRGNIIADLLTPMIGLSLRR